VFNVPGIVTAKRSNGFYLQDPNPDSSSATSDASLCFHIVRECVCWRCRSSQRPGQRVPPGGSNSTNLTITQISGASVVVLSSGNALPQATVIGLGGRVPPTEVIEDDVTGSVENEGAFDPAQMESTSTKASRACWCRSTMRLRSAPPTTFGEIPVLSDGGSYAMCAVQVAAS
jgi:hypothetical protein